MSNNYNYEEDKRTAHILKLVDVNSILENIKIASEFKVVIRDSDFKCIRPEMTPPKFTQAESKIQSFNKDLTATQQVASPKSAELTSLNPDIKSNFDFGFIRDVQL